MQRSPILSTYCRGIASWSTCRWVTPVYHPAVRTGALVMLDALGFKGIWDRAGVKERPGIVIEKLTALQRDVEAYIRQSFGDSEEQAIEEGFQG